MGASIMSDTGFEFKRNGDVLCHWRGDTYTIYAPTIGEMRQIEEYGAAIADEIKADPAHQAATEFMESLKDRDPDEPLPSDESDELLRKFNELSKAQSLRWFVRVLQLCGSDNWPRQIDQGTGQPMKDEDGYDRIDTDALPAAVRNRQLVSDIKAHWMAVPLADSPNGATKATVQNLTVNN